ncbi:MAG: hypothetical protein PHW63_07920 [Alphaproteobacteria bacterium]|nr:hypothetical protein [Alphaproteobacteria bacterium]
MDDFDLPDIERIVADIIGDLVRPEQIGVDKTEPYGKFNYIDENGEVSALEAHDFIVLSREGGYLDQDSFTDIIGLDVECWGKTRSRAISLSNEVTKRILRAETMTHLGFVIDYVEILRGPEEDKGKILLDDRVVLKAFEIHIRVKWH